MSLGRKISRAIPEAIYKEVQNVAEFMKARLFSSEHLWSSQFLQNCLRQGATNATRVYTKIVDGEEVEQFA